MICGRREGERDHVQSRKHSSHEKEFPDRSTEVTFVLKEETYIKGEKGENSLGKEVFGEG